MKALALFLLVFVSVSIASAQPVVVIVRHAEKAANGGSDPDLSSAGRARADELARILKDSGITAIFTSQSSALRKPRRRVRRQSVSQQPLFPRKILLRSSRSCIS